MICCFSLLIVAVTPVRALLTLRSDAEAMRARKQHTQLMIMLFSPHDHGCSLALPMFRKAASGWDSMRHGNVTFAVGDIEVTPDLAVAARAELGSLPTYLLFVQGLDRPVSYRGGWSEKSIMTWLQNQQAALQPIEVSSLDDLLGFARDVQPSLLVVGFLSTAQRERRLLEAAAREAQAQQATGVAVAHGNAALAAELDVVAPCIVAVRLGAATWPLLRGPGLAQQRVEDFLRQRVLPLLVPIGDSAKIFSAQVRAHPIQLQVLLIHRPSGQQGAFHEASEAALREMRHAAATFEGRALFLSYDFFDNNPETFTSRNVYASELPVVLLVHGRGGFNERTWRLPGGGERLDITAQAIESVVSLALSQTGSGDEHTSTGRRSDAVKRGDASANKNLQTIPAPFGSDGEDMNVGTARREVMVGSYGEEEYEEEDLDHEHDVLDDGDDAPVAV